jgi:hypothetical protein
MWGKSFPCLYIEFLYKRGGFCLKECYAWWMNDNCKRCI